ncbi:MAG: efflux RND transporter periplasmic adaptor subunit [bacterium]
MLEKKIKSGFLLLVLPTLFLLSCGDEELPERDLGTAVAVKTAQVEIQPVAETVTYAGTVQPLERVRLSTKIMGWVDQLYVQEGDAVHKGQLLVKLRSGDLEAKRAQAEAAIAEAEAYFVNVQTNLHRVQALYEKKAATKKELDDVRTAFASAKAKKAAAEQMKKQVEELLRYTALTAPFDGVVARKMVEAGDMANPGQPILEVENMSRVKIVVKVPESDIHDLHTGMPVSTIIAASHSGTNGRNYQGTIQQIVPAADPMSRQFEVKVLMDNPGRKIKSGMFARIRIGKTGQNSLLVPKEAVFRRGQLEGLFVVDSDNKAHLRWIRTGRATDDRIEILSGLSPGERVVVKGASTLTDGQNVEVLP